ncbi:ferritin-like domain-containing protein [Sphingomonas pituitosa]|uniref:ferritin-like domain-containing protein n=1 Tax=Sphingomonas pituitosa TaxID=99597 RepID=UPI001C3F58A4|nr:ferritin-like domain-containing protein [Sphingomonas pituitosa]
MLNQAIGQFWRGLIQHQTHLGLIASLGLSKLADTMQARMADEPQTLRSLLDRLLDLGGTPAFAVTTPTLGTDLATILSTDIDSQRAGLGMLNQCVLFAGNQSDAGTRLLFERIIVDEEEHLAWLLGEQSLLTRIGEAAYTTLRA